MKKKITVAATCLNENLMVLEFVNTIERYFKENLNNKYDYEILLADNNSSDGTQDQMRKLCVQSNKIKVVLNNLNYGADRSILNLIKYASGDAIISISCDLQEDIKIISNFLSKWESGKNYVVGQIISNDENILSQFIKKRFYNLYNKLSNSYLTKNSAGWLIDKNYNNILKQVNDPEPFARGIFSQILGVPETVPVIKRKRKIGKTKHNFFDYYSIAINGIAKSSSAVMRIITLSGFFLSLIFILISFYYLFMKIIHWDSFTLGLAPLIILICLLSSFLLLSIGLIGEYISAILEFNKNIPFVEKEKINFD